MPVREDAPRRTKGGERQPWRTAAATMRKRQTRFDSATAHGSYYDKRFGYKFSFDV
nr:MAG TPA: hypothetical protein [Bacteriophage sp.]